MIYHTMTFSGGFYCSNEKRTRQVQEKKTSWKSRVPVRIFLLCVDWEMETTSMLLHTYIVNSLVQDHNYLLYLIIKNLLWPEEFMNIYVVFDNMYTIIVYSWKKPHDIFAEKRRKLKQRREWNLCDLIQHTGVCGYQLRFSFCVLAKMLSDFLHKL